MLLINFILILVLRLIPKGDPRSIDRAPAIFILVIDGADPELLLTPNILPLSFTHPLVSVKSILLVKMENLMLNRTNQKNETFLLFNPGINPQIRTHEKRLETVLF